MNEILDDEILGEKPVFKINKTTCITWFCIFCVGNLFKILHWPGYTLLIILGASGFIAYTVFCYLRLRGKSTLNNVFLMLSCAWCVYILYGFFFDPERHFNEAGLMIHLVLLIVIYVLYEYFKKSDKKEEGIS